MMFYVVCVLLLFEGVSHLNGSLSPLQMICEVKVGYNGASCAWRFGLATCVCCPCSLDEGKIPLNVGDIITVTRWQRSVIDIDHCVPVLW